ncbi:MAG: hypothetical protein JNM94_09045 [Phycisphaerae bacterium]|nr:hypothetical protein [Phycisphaerae bacterium]
MNIASDGDTIQLAAGVYDEPFNLTKAVTIVGDSGDPSLYVVRPIPRGRIIGHVLVPIPAGMTVSFVGVELSGAVHYHVTGGSLHVAACRIGAPGDQFPAIEGTGTSMTFDECVFAGQGDFASRAVQSHGGAVTLEQCSTDSIRGANGLVWADQADVTLVGCVVSGCGGALSALLDVNGGSLLVDQSFVGNNDWIPAIRAVNTSVRIVDTELIANRKFDRTPASAFELSGPSVELLRVTSSGNGHVGFQSPYLISGASIRIEDSSFIDEVSSEYGSGTMDVVGSFEVSRTTFALNATAGVAGVGNFVGEGVIRECAFIENIGGDGHGAIGLSGAIAVVACRFEGNIAGDGAYFGSLRGGAALVFGGEVSFVDCDFLGNIAGFAPPASRFVNRGGAIAVTAGDLYVEGCRFYGNQTNASPLQVPDSGRGGAISIEGGSATIVESDFADNVAAGSGGAIYSAVADTAVIGCTIVGNDAAEAGGVGGTGTLTSSLVCGNAPTDTDIGWAVDGSSTVGCNVVHVPDDAATIQAGINSVLSGGIVVVAPGTYVETFSLAGKAFTLLAPAGRDDTLVDGTGFSESICLANSGETPATRVRGFTFRNGTSGHLLGPGVRAGGAFYGSASSPTIERCRFLNNASDFGGAAYLSAFDGSIVDCEFESNAAAGDAGALQLFAGSGQVIGCTFRGNEASVRGGACHVVEGDVVIADSLFEANEAPLAGAISWSFNPPTPQPTPLTIDGVTFRGNVAASGSAIAVTAGNTLPTLHLVAVCGNVGTPIVGSYVDLGCNVVCMCSCDSLAPWPDVDADGILDCEDPCIGRCPCVGDVDASGVVDGGDLALVLGAWSGSGAADVDGSGTVDGGDLAIVLGAWGPCE